MKRLTLLSLLSVSLFAQSQDVRQSIYANRPAANTYPNFYWTIVDCNSVANCTSGGSLGSLGTFFSNGTVWTEVFTDYGSLTNKPTLGTAAAQPTTAFDASGAASAVQAASLQKASNLSDLASAATARTNLGISTVGNTGAYADLTGKPTIPTVPKSFSGSSTTNASGVATFNVTSAGFPSAPTSCHFSATSGTAVAANGYNTTALSGYTSTSVSAFVTQPISILLGGLGVALVGSGITVQASCFQ